MKTPQPENTIVQIVNAVEAILNGQTIGHCACPPESLTPAQQLLRQALILRGQEKAEEGRTGTSVFEIQWPNCPDCKYLAIDNGRLFLMAAGVFALGRAANCMATSETDGMETTLAYRCAHCGGSYTRPAWMVDTTPRLTNGWPEQVTCLHCTECAGKATLITTSYDTCESASLTSRAATDAEANRILKNAYPEDIFWFNRDQRAVWRGLNR